MKTLLIAAAIAGAFLAGPAAAQMYVGAGAGSARTDTSDASWKAYAGYQFSPIWGLELGYTDLGRNRGADAESWSLAGTATLPLNERWSLLAKLGAAENHVHFHDRGRHADLLMGVGVGYAINKNVGLRLEYEDFGKLSSYDDGYDSRGSNLALSVKYSF